MKAKELIKKLEKLNPEHDVIFWDGQDNYDVNNVDNDDVNKIEIILS